MCSILTYVEWSMEYVLAFFMIPYYLGMYINKTKYNIDIFVLWKRITIENSFKNEANFKAYTFDIWV